MRELEEEAGITLSQDVLEPAGKVTFLREANPERDQIAHIFRGKYNGSFSETEEMKPQRFDTDNLPLQDMRENDAAWMPKLISGEYLNEVSHFDKEGKRIK